MDNMPLMLPEGHLMPWEAALVKDEIEAMRESAARLGVMESRERRHWSHKIDRARERYAQPARKRPVRTALLVGWAMIWMVIFGLYDRLSAINRSAL